jgi:uncharacterized protein YjbI with pentapeptide repeats
MKEAVDHAIERMEELERNTAIVKFNFSRVPPHGEDSAALEAWEESRQYNKLVEEYVFAHQKAIKANDTASPAFGSFNEYLQAHELFKNNPKYQDKVIVAEISGSIEDVNDEYGLNPNGITLEGGDFSGVSFVDIDISTSLKGVSFRDCYFDKASLKSAVTGVDFRGSKLKDCTFFDYSSADLQSLIGLRFSFANATEVQKIGLFGIKDNLLIADKQQKFEEKAIKERDAKVKALKEKITAIKAKSASNRGWFEMAVGLVAETQYDKTVLQQVARIEKAIEEVHKKHVENLKKQFKEIENSNLIRLEGVQPDPTYIPNQSRSEAEKEKISIRATREDLVAYLATDKSLSLQEYILGLGKNSAAVAAHQAKNKNAAFVIDFSGEDISGQNLSDLELSGINFAYTNATNAIFNGSRLIGACFEGAIIDGAQFEKADLTDANCVGAKADKMPVNFKGAALVRAQMQYTKLSKVNMEYAILYSADFTGTNIEHGMMMHADARKSDFENANLRSVDASYVKMKKAKLSKAVLEDANFFKANLAEAVMNNTQAARAKFEDAVMNGVTAHHADFRAAIMDRLTAKGANFSDADFEEVSAQFANLEGALMDRLNAVRADFTSTVMTDVHAHESNFTKAVLSKVEGERLDISGAILRDAHLESAQLKGAIMEKIEAERANFTKANLEEANLKFANLKKAVLDEANLKKAELVKAELEAASLKAAQMQEANIQGANLIAANLEKADVTGVKFDTETLLLDANLRGVIGGEALKELQEQQHKIRDQWFGQSRYGYCENNKDVTNDRFKCQRLGAAVLSAAIGGGAGFAAGGPLGGLSGALVTGMIADKSLERIRDGYYGNLGYINNSIGDRLAEIGVIAQSLGINAADKAIDGAAAGLICSSVGLTKSAAALTVGAGVSYAGLKLLQNGFSTNSKFQQYAGGGLAAVGGVTAAAGGASLATSSSAVVYGAAIGATLGGTKGAYDAMNDLIMYDEKKKTGKKPEELYRENISKAHKIWKKFMPSASKLLAGMILAGVFLSTTCLAGGLILGTSIVAIALISEIAAVATTAGFVGGYLYGDKIPLLNKLHAHTETHESKEVAGEIDQHIPDKEKIISSKQPRSGLHPVTDILSTTSIPATKIEPIVSGVEKCIDKGSVSSLKDGLERQQNLRTQE